MNVREILTRFKFTADTDPLKRMEGQLESIKNTLHFLAATEIIKGIVELTERFSKFAEELQVAATGAGMTVEAFQALTFAASQSAISQEQLGMSMIRLSRHLYAARTGSEEAQKVFRQAGFNKAQIDGFKNAEDVLMALSAQLQNIQDPFKKAAITQELLGRGSQKMIAFLSEGPGAIRGKIREASELGTVLSTKQIADLKNVQDAIEKVYGVIKSIGATFASYLAPSIESAVNHFLKFYKAHKDLLFLNIKDWADKFMFSMGRLWAVIEFVTDKVLDFIQALHMEGHIGSALFYFGKYVAALFAIEIGFGAAGKALSVFKFLLSPFDLAIKAITKTLLFLAETVLPLFISEELAAGIAAAIAEAPFWAMVVVISAIAAGLGLVIGFVQLLYTLAMGGSFKDSWLGQFADAFGEGIGGKLFSAIFPGIGKKVEGPETNTSFLPDVNNAINNFKLVPEMNKMPAVGAMAGNTNTSASNTTHNLIAPLTVNISSNPPMTPEHAGRKLKESVDEHMKTLALNTGRLLGKPVIQN